MNRERLDQIKQMLRGPVVDELIAEVDACWVEFQKLNEVATAHGWNGIENSKILHVFFENELAELGSMRSMKECPPRPPSPVA